MEETLYSEEEATWYITDIYKQFTEAMKANKLEVTMDITDKLGCYYETILFWYGMDNPERGSEEVNCMMDFAARTLK